MLFSPTDGTLLSGFDIGDTFVFQRSGAVDGHGNSLVTGTYWPSPRGRRPVGSLSLPAGSQNNQPLFLAVLDGLSRAVSVLDGPHERHGPAVRDDHGPRLGKHLRARVRWAAVHDG